MKKVELKLQEALVDFGMSLNIFPGPYDNEADINENEVRFYKNLWEKCDTNLLTRDLKQFQGQTKRQTENILEYRLEKIIKNLIRLKRKSINSEKDKIDEILLRILKSYIPNKIYFRVRQMNNYFKKIGE